MWDVYVIDDGDIFMVNSQPLNLLEAERFHSLLTAKGLTAFLFLSGCDFPMGSLCLCDQI